MLKEKRSGRRRLVVCALCISFTVAAAFASASVRVRPAALAPAQKTVELPAETVRAIFAPITAELKRRSGVPVRLPKRLTGVTSEDPQVYAMIEKAGPAGYTVDVDFDPQCMGATACHHGTVYAQKATPRNSRLRGRLVRLAQGMSGYFVDAQCGASCSESKLSWKQDNTIYTVAIKAGALSDLTAMANSMLASNPL